MTARAASMTQNKDEGRWTTKGRATRARIVAAAAELMFEHGVARTSTEEVREAAGVSNSQLYHYFDSKDALVRAVIGHQTQRVLDSQQPLLGRLDSFEALQAWRDVLLGIQVEEDCPGCGIGTFISQLTDSDQGALEDLRSGFDQWEAAIRDGLSAMRDGGELRPDADPDSLALMILSALQGGMLLTAMRHEVLPLKAALDGAISQVRSYAARNQEARRSDRRPLLSPEEPQISRSGELRG
jgi:TetR/AcrR family transcriptional regulator, transcriptional repressor for nem operon